MSFDVSLPARGTTLTLEHSSTAPAGPAVPVIPVRGGESLSLADGLTGAQVPPEEFLEALRALGATGKLGEVTRVPTADGLALTIGLGSSADADGDSINPEDAVRRAAGSLGRALRGAPASSVIIPTGPTFAIGPVVEGLLLGGYRYAGRKAQGETKNGSQAEATGELPTVTVLGPDTPEAREEFQRAVIVSESALLVRDLVNTPANELYPESYAHVMEQVAAETGLTVEVFDEDYLADNGFGGILAVGRGSARPPRLVHLVWEGREEPSGPRVALVGKGITFDTGGISLKPPAKMEEMISDMGGSAAQLGAIAAAARLALPLRVEAWLPLAENMPSGTASRPGDVITHYGGITTEILNTDAEGRLVLADAIARATQDHPDYLIETATLTGAQMTALGNRTAGVMGSAEFRDRIAATGRQVGENAWAMPLLEEQEEELSSPVADVRNANPAKSGGMLFAGLYLSRFVEDGTQWAHIDVAGPAWNTGSPYDYTPARATGTPVRTVIQALSDLAQG